MLTVKAVEQARARIRDSIYLSPCAHSQFLSDLTGNQVFLKLENLQMTGSFKERGALHKILTLTDEEKRQGVIAASAGNHAQGVAYHATRNQIRSTIVMPEGAALFKVTRTREYGARVELHGASYDEAFAEALRRSQAEGLTLIHAFDDEAVMAGQGSIGLELAEQNPRLEAVVVAVGGGGLISGIAVAMKEKNPRLRVIGVESARLPSMKRALEAGAPVELPAASTLADGIAVRKAGVLTCEVVARYVDEIVTVDEEEIANAILLLLEREKTVAEGAGAVALAALVQGKTGCRGQNVALVVSGGNIDVNLLARIIERGLVADGRRVRLRVRIQDHPGALHRLTGVIATVKANVLDVHHDRAFAHVELGETSVDVTLETRGPEHIAELTRLLDLERYQHERLF